jgi:diguanylate cyclase (GGDEF)-like protein
MGLFDPRTVVLLASVMAALMSLVLFSLRRNFPSSIHGLGTWAASPLVLCFATLMGGLRGGLPDLLSIGIPNVLLFVGVYLAYLGSQRFLGQPTAIPRWSVFIALTAIPAYWFTVVEPDFRARLLILSLPLGLLFALHAGLLYRHAARSFASQLLTGVMVAGTLLQIVRFILIGLMPEDRNAFNPASPQPLFLAAYVLIVLLMSVGLVLLATERLRAEFETLAAHDSLTNAYTRRYINEACQQELERSRRHGHVMALLLMDLDHFKAINDTYGHQQGDQVLVDFVTRVQALLRRPDQLGRFGGEEFVLLLPETPLDEALAVAERIRAIATQSRETLHCSVSIGVTTNRLDNDTLDSLLARADKALYRAKENGRNRVEFA